MLILRTNAIAGFFRNRGVSLDHIQKYRKDIGHGFQHAEKVFLTSQKLLDLAGVKIKSDDLRALSSISGVKDLTPSLELACAFHDLTDAVKRSDDLDGIFPGLKQKITQNELGGFLVAGEYGVTQGMVDHFYGQIAQLNAAQGEIPIRQFHHLSAAILAYNLLAEDPNFEGDAIDAKLVALAVLSHNEMNAGLVPKHPVIGALMDADTLAEFDIGRMIDINIKAGRVLFDKNIKLMARREMTEDQHRPEEIEADSFYGKTGKWLDTFQYTMVRLISNLSKNIYRDPKAVSMLLGENNGLFDKALTDAFAAIKEHARSREEIIDMSETLKWLIKEAKDDPQYQFSLPLLSKAEDRINDELLWPPQYSDELPASYILKHLNSYGLIAVKLLDAGIRTRNDLIAINDLIVAISKWPLYSMIIGSLPDSRGIAIAHSKKSHYDLGRVLITVIRGGKRIIVFDEDRDTVKQSVAKAEMVALGLYPGPESYN